MTGGELEVGGTERDQEPAEERKTPVAEGGEIEAQGLGRYPPALDTFVPQNQQVLHRPLQEGPLILLRAASITGGGGPGLGVPRV